MTDPLSHPIRELGKRLSDPPDGPSVLVGRRWGVIVAIAGAPPLTVDVDIGGVTVPGVRYYYWYTPVLNDTVVVEIAGGDPIVVGALA